MITSSKKAITIIYLSAALICACLYWINVTLENILAELKNNNKEIRL